MLRLYSEISNFKEKLQGIYYSIENIDDIRKCFINLDDAIDSFICVLGSNNIKLNDYSIVYPLSKIQGYSRYIIFAKNNDFTNDLLKTLINLTLECIEENINHIKEICSYN